MIYVLSRKFGYNLQFINIVHQLGCYLVFSYGFEHIYADSHLINSL